MSLASFAGIVILSLNVSGPDTAQTKSRPYGWIELGGAVGHTESFTRAGVETALGFGSERVTYFINSPVVLTFVERHGTWRYSFQGPVNFLTFLVGAGIAGVTPPAVGAPVMMLLNVWNSHLSVKLTDRFGASCALSTEYLFYTTNGAARGIELSPSVGVYFDLPRGPDRWRIFVGAQHSSFLNFEGPNADDGFGFDLRIVLNGVLDQD